MASPAPAATGTALVKVREGTSSTLLRAAGGVTVAAPLRVWRVPASSVPRLRRVGAVLFAERDRVLASEVSAADAAVGSGARWRDAIGADAAAPAGPGKPVTIVDSGLDITHSEFAQRPNTTLLNEQTVSQEDDDHGTEVASVIGAARGMTGVYPQAVLRSWDASPLGFLSTAEAVRGIVAAANGGPGVINLSFGGEDDDPLIHQAVLYAFKHGSLVVASSGNDGLIGNPLSYPAGYPHVLTVGATDETGTVASFSSQSNTVDLVAPGRHIQVAEPVADDPTGYILASGTSFSSPMVAGAAAWVWTVHPTLDNTQLFDTMRFSAHDLAPAGHDRASGFGMLNIPSALAYASPPKDPLEPNDDVDQVSPRGIFAGGQPAITTRGRLAATIAARVDRQEDPHDVYRVYVPAGGSVTARTTGGAVDLRIFLPDARMVNGRAAAASIRRGTQPDSVRLRNRTKRAYYAYVEVRPDPLTLRTSYSLRVSATVRR